MTTSHKLNIKPKPYKHPYPSYASFPSYPYFYPTQYPLYPYPSMYPTTYPYPYLAYPLYTQQGFFPHQSYVPHMPGAFPLTGIHLVNPDVHIHPAAQFVVPHLEVHVPPIHVGRQELLPS